MPAPRIRPRRAAPVAAVAAGLSAAGFAAVTTLVSAERLRVVDRRVHERLGREHGRAARRAATTIGYLGKPWAHSAVAALLATLVSHKGSLDGERAIKLSSALSSTASRTFDWLLPHRAPPPGRRRPSEQSYPSGHTLETAAVALTAAYVLWREGLADARIATPVAVLLPLIEGTGRIYLDRHWASDVLGGVLAGVSVAALCVTGYEVRRGTSRGGAPRRSG